MLLVHGNRLKTMDQDAKVSLEGAENPGGRRKPKMDRRVSTERKVGI